MSGAGPSDDDILHITTPEAWDEGRRTGTVPVAGLAGEGFVHCSTRAQLAGTLARHFAGAGPLVGLVLDVGRLGDLRWEESDTGVAFPHLYEPLAASAVTSVEPLVAPPAPTG